MQPNSDRLLLLVLCNTVCSICALHARGVEKT
jgi:hypothetical protein